MTGSWKNIRRRATGIIWVILVLAGPLFAQELVFEHFSSNHGLSNNLIRDIIQDDEGYLWFATSGGLNRFDGYLFDIYKPTQGDTLSISDSRISELMLDRRGFLWSRSSLGNFHRIDSKKKQVLNLKELGVLPPGTRVLAQQLSADGDLWLRLNSGMLRIYYTVGSGDRFSYQYYHADNLLPDNQVYFIYPDSRHQVWVGTAGGMVRMQVSRDNSEIIFTENFFVDQPEAILSAREQNGKIFFGTGNNRLVVYDHEKQQFEEVTTGNNTPSGNVRVMMNNYRDEMVFGTDVGDVILYDPALGSYEYFEQENTPGLDSMVIGEVFADSYGMFWLISDRRGIYSFNPERKVFKYHGLNFADRMFLGEPDKQLILEDSNRDLWVGINGGGLFLYDRGMDEFIQLQHDPNKTTSISSDIVLSLYEDRSKNLWIGTSYGGINKLSLKQSQFTHITLVAEPKTDFDNYVRSVTADPLGNIYLGTKAGKIFVYRGTTRIGTIPDDLYDPSIFPVTNIYCLYFDNDHNLWVGTKGKGLYVFKSFLGYYSNLNHPGIQLQHITSDAEAEISIHSENVYSIVRDYYGQYWVGGFTGGLYLLTDPFGDQKITRFTADEHADNNIVSDEVRHLLLDNGHNLWIATSEGISILENRYLQSPEKKFINLQPSISDTTNLSGKVVYQVMQSRNEDIYVAMLDGGINQLRAEDFENRSFRWIHHESPILSSNVYGIREDDNGNIWMGTDNGLFRMHRDGQMIERFDVGSNILPLTFSESCAAGTNRHELVFGSNKGFILFQPSEIHKDTTQFPLVFSRLEINGEWISSTHSGILDLDIDAQRSVVLDHTQRNITLHFSVLDYDHPSAVQYSSFLEGLDNYWSKPSTVNYVNYRQLDPGDYVLHVRGTNSSGAWLNEEATMTISINPPFWKSIEGNLLISLILLVFLVAAAIIVFRQIRIQNKLKIEKAITEKRIEYYTNISHEFKTPLSLILNPVEEIINSHKSSDFSRQKGVQIKNNATYLKRLIEQMLDFRKLREGRMQLKITELNLVAFFNEIYLIFLPLSKKLNIKFSFEHNLDEYFGYADFAQLEKITYNLLSNAFRFTPAGKEVTLNMQIDESDKKLVFTVEDEGPGISVDELPRIFDRFYMSKSSTGIGLFFTRELVYLHKGEIEAGNKEEGGAVFTISIPVGPASYTSEEMLLESDKKLSFDFHPIDDIETIVSTPLHVGEEHIHVNSYMASILIVEDNTEMLNYLGTELSKKFKVYKARDGQQGLSMTRKHLPDLVLSDVKMSVMNGYELTRAIKDNYYTSHIPVILLTAESSEEMKIEGIASGADDYIEKPFNLNYLFTKIDKTILQRKKLIKRFDNETRENVIQDRRRGEDDSEFITTVQNLINEHLSNSNLDVEFLVEQMGISRTLFFKKVKASIGFSPNEYIRILRMKAAARMLSSSRNTINEIGFSIGYNDPNYFGKTFKKHFGITPSEYRATAEKR
ncbi:MAG: two-component regulator propeller domain-containing protein [Bacteroidales bacterium]|nr:two-component regulator propeller domain-containing protein [Bacteroidales bacterium]MDT8430164.1 two-component regulator propeller domain-containing protein [Bacteroidales bacterium]